MRRKSECGHKPNECIIATTDLGNLGAEILPNQQVPSPTWQGQERVGQARWLLGSAFGVANEPPTDVVLMIVVADMIRRPDIRI